MGVYVSADSGATFQLWGRGLPFNRIYDMYVGTSTLATATYGRSVWAAPLYDPAETTAPTTVGASWANNRPSSCTVSSVNTRLLSLFSLNRRCFPCSLSQFLLDLFISCLIYSSPYHGTAANEPAHVNALAAADGAWLWLV